MVEISQNFVAFSEYMNFMYNCTLYFQNVETRRGKAFEFDLTILLPISLKFILKDSNRFCIISNYRSFFFIQKARFQATSLTSLYLLN